ncbi:ABC transporter ATP-binding protein [Priestia filamentosa]|uniref:ABC transporter ATP-binding protein n=1 Tax=Priestia filamentosa TaxID=1402861 RepID=A0A1X7EDT1_9BACI|nr:ABC transporter ATP-binding protein [Priestia filamentosa]AKO92795.1 ABC transporter ATP-binding protein [Priestia filamentosa]MDT3762829.1 ABC transporter ATP-binding protein [Priestia filamentosa]OXS69364.1 ABC transporter ATP-binding protein [Priestia filamentosa]RJS63921.1 ABC transporter ATP-binding protein [Priestia filamentosa]WCM13927.1 ABC transporter ATP-binding protein [Priestia filamentosa]
MEPIPIMELRNITKHYKNKIVLENVSFSIYSNQIIALVGKNGSGKSTLLKIIGGLVKSDSGEVYKPASPLKIGYVPEITPSHIPFTLEEYLIHMGNIRGMDKQHLRQRIDCLLEIFHLQEDRQTAIAELSKGMKQKVIIMQSMIEETDFLILDEPLSGLDPKAQNDMETILLSLKQRGLSIIFTCHEMKLIENLVDRLLCIKNHQIVQTSVPVHAAIGGNKLVFSILAKTSLKEVLPLMKIQQQHDLNSNVNEIEAIVKPEDTDKLLRELLQRGASIKKLFPINEDNENLYSYFERGKN